MSLICLLLLLLNLVFKWLNHIFNASFLFLDLIALLFVIVNYIDPFLINDRSLSVSVLINLLSHGFFLKFKMLKIIFLIFVSLGFGHLHVLNELFLSSCLLCFSLSKLFFSLKFSDSCFKLYYLPLLWVFVWMSIHHISDVLLRS